MSAVPVVIRETRLEDIPGVIALCRAVYPDAAPWTAAQLESHLEIFPEGQLVAERLEDGAIVGMAASLIILWDDYDQHDSWRDFTDRGFFSNHDPIHGRTLYGAEIMIDPAVQGRGVGSQLYAARRALAERLGVLRIRAGARLRGYHLHAASLTPVQYVNAVVAGTLADPTLTFQLHRGFHVIDVVSGYLMQDPESLGYAAIIQWLNPALATAEDYRVSHPELRPLRIPRPGTNAE